MNLRDEVQFARRVWWHLELEMGMVGPLALFGWAAKEM